MCKLDLNRDYSVKYPFLLAFDYYNTSILSCYSLQEVEKPYEGKVADMFVMLQARQSCNWYFATLHSPRPASQGIVHVISLSSPFPSYSSFTCPLPVLCFLHLTQTFPYTIFSSLLIFWSDSLPLLPYFLTLSLILCLPVICHSSVRELPQQTLKPSVDWLPAPLHTSISLLSLSFTMLRLSL